MKRYTVVPTFDRNIKVIENEKGIWVDAEIAQELYDALKASMKYFDQVIIETGYQSEGEAIAHNNCKKALAKAEEI